MEYAERDDHQNDELNEKKENVTPNEEVKEKKKDDTEKNAETHSREKPPSAEPVANPENLEVVPENKADDPEVEGSEGSENPVVEKPEAKEEIIPEEIEEEDLPSVEDIEKEIKELDGEKATNDKEEKGKEQKEEQINFELLSQADLVKVLEDTLNKPFEEFRGEVEKIQEVFEKKHVEEIAGKKERFLAEGGLEQDFKPADDPLQLRMTELSEKYKTLKADYSRQLEETKETNLTMKLEILEEFRILMEGQEGFDNTFRKFKQLQTRWFDVGIVPKQNVKDLWNSYNFFVEKFNDFVKINRELRALDFQKNLDLKNKLCERAEQLAEDKNVLNAFKKLQKLHAQWRDIGPVPREEKDTIWERFKAATSLINKAHQAYQAEMKESLVVNLELKKELCEKVENLAQIELKTHKDWSEKTRELLGLQKDWKKIGYAPKKDNNVIYARFRKACDAFFEKKAAFYAETFEQQKENVKQKKEIINEAETLKDSTDWRQTTEKLIALQKKWKGVGPVPRKESDKLWKQFRSACDYFFLKKTEHFEGKNEDYESNQKEKEDLIKEIKSYKPYGDEKEILNQILIFQERYNKIGFVPAEVKDKIRDDYKEAINIIIDSLEVDQQDKGLLRFRLKMLNLTDNPKAENKLHFERDKLITKLQQLRNEIGIWENNIGFFKQTKSSEDTITEFHEKIEEAKTRIDTLENKIKIIDEIDDSL